MDTCLGASSTADERVGDSKGQSNFLLTTLVPSTSRSDPVEHFILLVLFFRRGARVRRWIDFDVKRSVGGFRLFALNLGRLDPSELI